MGETWITEDGYDDPVEAVRMFLAYGGKPYARLCYHDGWWSLQLRCFTD
jgi:hypothetical protein